MILELSKAGTSPPKSFFWSSPMATLLLVQISISYIEQGMKLGLSGSNGLVVLAVPILEPMMEFRQWGWDDIPIMEKKSHV